MRFLTKPSLGLQENVDQTQPHSVVTKASLTRQISLGFWLGHTHLIWIRDFPLKGERFAGWRFGVYLQLLHQTLVNGAHFLRWFWEIFRDSAARKTNTGNFRASGCSWMHHCLAVLCTAGILGIFGQLFLRLATSGFITHSTKPMGAVWVVWPSFIYSLLYSPFLYEFLWSFSWIYFPL